MQIPTSPVHWFDRGKYNTNTSGSHDFLKLGIAETWIQYGTGQRKCFIPLHELARSLGERKSRVVLQAHVLSGCDVTSKIGTKVSVLRHEPEKYLEHFGETETVPDDVFRLAEKYRIHVGVVAIAEKCIHPVQSIVNARESVMTRFSKSYCDFTTFIMYCIM